MATPKNNKKKKKSTVVIYDEICYLANPSPIPPRCAKERPHIFASAWLGHSDVAEGYYKFIYNKSNKEIISVGSFKSFEELLRGLNKELSKTQYKNKKLGDLIILTHAVQFLSEVKIEMPLFSMKNPDETPRSLPGAEWWDNVQVSFGAAEINDLLKPTSELYKYVDGQGKKEGLISMVAKNLSNYMDSETHVWFTGCNIGKDKSFLKALRKLFRDKPTIYALNKYHFIFYYWDANGNGTGGAEKINEQYDKKSAKALWTKDGMASIVHEP